MAPSSPKGNPSRRSEEHSESQRSRILEAAKRCFIERGFHATSISDIARLAGISQGLMYRYFDNKRALIMALIEMQLVENRNTLSGLPVSTDFVVGLSEAYALWAKGDPKLWNAGLFSEITAECMRDTQVAEVLRRSESGSRKEFCAWLKRRDTAQGTIRAADEIELRAVLMQCLVEGLAVRAAREPELDEGLIRTLLERVLPLIMGSEKVEETAVAAPGTPERL